MSERLFSFVLKRPLIALLIGLTLIIVAASGAQKLVFKSDYRVFFGSENPQLQAFEAMQKIYSKSDNVAFVIAAKDKEVFTQEHLTAIQKITEEAWQVPYSTRVDSVTNYQYSHAEEDDLIVEDLIYEPNSLDQNQLNQAKAIAINDPLIKKRLISTEGHVAVVSVTLHFPGINPIEEVPAVASKVREIRDQIEQVYPSLDIMLSGVAMMNTSFAESSLDDNATLVPLMFLVVILTIGLMLRTITGTLATVVVIIASIATTMGIAGWTGFYLTGPSASAPTIILTLAVADCIHILTSMFYEMRHGVKKKLAMLDSLRINLKPIFLTSATTAIGFLAMNFSDSPPFRDLGNMVAMGVMLAFVFSVTIFPAILMLLPLRVKQKVEGDKDVMLSLSTFVINNRRILLPAMSVILIAISIFVPKNELNDDFVKYFDKTVEFRQATDFMQDNLSGMSTIELSIDSGVSSGINSPEFLQVVENFSNWMRQQPETDHVNTITDIIKRLNKNMHGDNEAWYKLPDNQELAAQYLLLYEMSLPYGLDLNNQLNVDKSSTRVVVTLKNQTSNEQLMTEKRITAWFVEHAPQYKATLASPTLMFAHIGQRNVISMITGTGIALILISLVLGFALRSVRFGLISLLPNILPATVAFGVWGLLVGQIGLSLSIVASMTLGIVVDDTVHFLSKYLHARRNKGADTRAAVQYAFSSVGRALWITTFVLVCGFMVLAQSTFKVNAEMGLMTAITILIALIVDFLFLPPLLMMLDNEKNSKDTSDQENSMNKKGVAHGSE
jgi:predicted RND superfamily exporter protein